jgi:hypothetical protein
VNLALTTSAWSRIVGHLRATRLLLIGVSVFGMSAFSHAQSCALCYTQAASSGSRLIHGLRSGILVLIVPPALMSVGITILAYRKRNQFNDSVKDSRANDW